MAFWPFDWSFDSSNEDDSTWLASTLLAFVVGSAFTVYRWKIRPPVILPSGVSRRKQAIPIKDEVSAFKSGLLVNTDKEIEYCLYPEITTLYELFLRGLEISENNRCLGQRAGKGQPYKFISYAETYRCATNIGSTFVNKLGVKPGNNTRVGIYARNSSEWFITCLGCVRLSIVIVPLYDTLGADAATYIVQQTEMEIIVVDEKDKIEKLVANASEMPTLKHVVIISEDKLSPELVKKAEQSNLQIHRFNQLQNEQVEVYPDVEPKPDDLYIICYTSGTTGTPKGVMLSHKNVVANVSGVIRIIQSFVPSMDNPNQLSISYLPLSHMFEQVVHWCLFILGGAVGYYSGDVKLLMDDMKDLKPTIFPTVPRLLNRLYGILQKMLENPNFFIRSLLNIAYKRKLAIVKRGIVQRDSLWDKIVFNKFQQQLGGEIQLVVTGSAPISGEVLDASRVAFGAHVLEGYGQTECTAMVTMTWPFETKSGHCGGPSTCNKIKLEDVPELNYFSSERKGELLIKGSCVTRGYYKNAEQTRKLFDADGYLHTGDIAHLLPNGCLKIIDRKKHIFKLAQGEYVAPEKIENVYVKCSLIQQVYVDGDSLESFLVAIVVPEAAELTNWYKQTTNVDKSLKEICLDKRTREHILQEMFTIGRQNHLNSVEQVKAIYLEPDPFTVENDLLTPTFKSKRSKLREHYKNQIASLYKEA